MGHVVLDRVSKRYGDIVAVDDLTLEIAESEFFVLLGPTGAGKTSTLRLIAGLDKPDSGRVWIDGVDVTRLPTARRDATFVFQQFSLYPNYSVRQNLAFPLKAPARRMDAADIENRTQWVAERLAIVDKLDNPVTALSGGEMQRVALGRALMRRPAVHLMDEPLSALDAKLREALRAELKYLQSQINAPIIYVTHDQEEALALADRIGVIHDGRLMQVDAPEAIYKRPDSLAVARQLGSPTINTVATEVLQLPDDRCVTVGVRPEDISLRHDASPGESALCATVSRVEQLGAENTVVVDINDTSLSVLTSPIQQLAPGDRVIVEFRQADLLAFDADGWRIASHDVERPVYRTA